MADRKQVEMLFRKHYRAMYRLARLLLHDDVESKDIVSDVFAQILDGETLREETAAAFLLTCVRNRCLNVMRDRQIQEQAQRLYLLDAELTVNTEDEEGFEDELAALQRGIDALQPPRRREIILLHYRDNLTFREIAGRLQISETAVYKHLRNALNQLRTQLKKH